jgi:hypothetical protein
MICPAAERPRADRCHPGKSGVCWLVSRVDLALLVLVLVTVAFLFWSRNVVVRTPGVSSPLWSGIRLSRADLGRVAATGPWPADNGYGIVLPRAAGDAG